MTKIAILGLGYSINEFNPDQFDASIGVNDIWKYHKTDAVVCLDKPSMFEADRLKVINDCSPKRFYSQLVIYDSRSDFYKIDFLPGYPDVYCQLDTIALHKSYCSPFVAAQIAFKDYFASEIHLFGVDLVNHPHLDKTLCDRIKKHFRNLKVAFTEKNCDLIVHGEGILKDI
jgi:hypothetical protein